MPDEARLNELLDLVEQARAEGDTATEQKAAAAYKAESQPSRTPNIDKIMAPRLGTGEPHRGRYQTIDMRRQQFMAEYPRPEGMYDMNPTGQTDSAKFIAGLPEMALSGVTGGAGVLADVATLSDPGTHDWAYRPRSEPGQFAAQSIGEVAAPVLSGLGRGYDKAFGTGPLASTVKERGTQALEAVGTVLGATGAVKGAMALRPTPLTAEQTLARQFGTAGSQGAAAAAPDLTGASPELLQAVVKTGKRGTVNADVLQRHRDAETLPVPVRLLEGEATADPVMISMNRNLRGRSPEIARHMDDTNRALGQNLEVLRDRVGENVFSTNATEHGQALTDAYTAMDDAANTEIRGAYDALTKAANGRFPIGAKTLLRNVEAGLKKKLKTHYAPTGEMQMLREWAAKPGSMTFEDFEALRTNLATIQRTSTDGNARAAAGIIRQKMEELPLAAGSEKLKALADNARTLARTRFERLEADPAYKAVVEEGIKPGDFVQKFIVSGAKDPADVARMVQAIPESRQTIATALVNYLQDQARVGPGMTGNFSAEGYTRALRRIDPIARYIFSPEDIEMLEKLGRVSRYTTAQPKGSFVNNSNTFVSAAASGFGKTLEGIANTGGTGLGTAASEAFGRQSTRRQYGRISAPGAGLDYSRPPTK